MEPDSPSLLGRAPPPPSSLTLSEPLEATLAGMSDPDYKRGLCNSNIVLKLALCAGERSFTELLSSTFVANIMQMMSTLTVPEGMVSVFRAFLCATIKLCKGALKGASKNGESLLSFAVLDLLRSTCPGVVKEYSKLTREQHDSRTRDVVQGVQLPAMLERCDEAYATADLLTQNLEGGLAELERISSLSDMALSELLQSSVCGLTRAVVGIVFSSVFDGRRLQAGVYMAARVDKGAHVPEQSLKFTLSASHSQATLARIKAGVCFIVGLARLSLASDYQGSELFERPEWKAINQLEKAVNGYMKARKEHLCQVPQTSIKGIVCNVADWFQKAVENDDMFNALYRAFTARAFDLNSDCTSVGRIWPKFKASKGGGSVSLFEAAEFFVSAKELLLKTPTSLVSALLAVLGGAVGGLFNDKLKCMFVITDYDGSYCASVYKQLPACPYPRTMSTASGSHKANRDGNSCSASETTEIMRSLPDLRNEHEKSTIDARLAASLTIISIQESIRAEIPKKVSPFTTEGMKDMHSIGIVAARTLPAIILVDRNSTISSLIETHKDAVKSVANGTNVEKPWRDLRGGAILSTLLRWVVQRAFKDTLDALGCEWKSTTNNVVNIFLAKLKIRSQDYFNDNYLASKEKIIGYKSAKTCFALMRTFVDLFCTSASDAGLLWEQLTNTFSQSREFHFRNNGFDLSPTRKRKLLMEEQSLLGEAGEAGDASETGEAGEASEAVEAGEASDDFEYDGDEDIWED